MINREKTIVLGVAGGISAYKAVACASRLAQAGHAVHVAMSPGALEFVQPLSFAAVSGKRVVTSIFPDAGECSGDDLYPHLYPASQADLFLLAPASADMIAKIAHGLADDPVCAGALALAPGCPRLFCPAMHVNMWAQRIVRDNSAKLEDMDWERIGPEEGVLACGSRGEGRMSEPEKIVGRVLEILNRT